MRKLKSSLAASAAVLTAALALSACSGSPAAGAGSAVSSSKLTDITVIEGGATPGRLPFYVALYSGLFQKYGLKVTLAEATSDAQASQVLAGGKVQYELGLVTDGLNLALDHEPVDALAMMTDRYFETVLVAKKYQGKIKNFSDLAGMPFGITGVGSGTWQLAQFIAKAGAVPASKMDLVNVGAATIASGQALSSGRVAVMICSDPTDLQLVDSGKAYYLADTINLKDGAGAQYPAFVKLATEPYIYNWLFGTKSYVSAHGQVTQDLLDAMQAAQDQIYRDTPAQTATILAKNPEFASYSHALLTQLVTRERDTSKGLPLTLTIPEANYANTVSFAAQLKKTYTSVAYSSVVDNVFASKAAKTVGPARQSGS